ncbi:MAG: Dabb family protein [Actinomycetota bacterium]|nr:Dabb family protein [Actinomycetota bacterium]
MIRHCVLFRWAPDATEEARSSVFDGLAALAARLDGVFERYTFGPDAGLNDGTWDVAIVADFADRAAYETYRDDAGHRELIAETIRPAISERAAVQLEL